MPQPAQGSTSPRGPRRSSRLDLPRDPILGRLSCLDLPGDSISRRLSRLSLPGDLHPDPGMPGAQVAAVLHRISFRKTHPYESPPTEIEGSLLVVGLCLVSAITQEPSENPIAFLERLKEALQKFANLDLDSYEGQVILKDTFLSQLASDVRIKLQQLQQQDPAASLD